MVARSRSSRRRRVAVFVLVQLVVVLVALEVVIRLAGPRLGLRTLLYLPAADTHYDSARTLEQLMERSMLGFRPYETYHGFVLNSRSLRTKEYAERPAPGTRRILAFGDSFTFASGGLPHRWHWTTVLEELLGGDRPVEVLRLGVPGTGPLFQYRLWQLEGARLGADTVLQAFFVGNDFVDHRDKAAHLLGEDASFRTELARRWWTFRVARNLARTLRGAARRAVSEESRGSAAPVGGVEVPGYEESWDPDRPSFDEEAFLAIEARRMALCRVDLAREFEQLLEDVGRTLLAFEREVAARGARFVVVIIPDEYQVDPAVRAAAMEVAGTAPSDYDLDRPQRRLTAWLDAHGIESIDLLPAFRRAAPGRKLYNLRDTHWNRAGNRVAAEVVAARLRPPPAGDAGAP